MRTFRSMPFFPVLQVWAGSCELAVCRGTCSGWPVITTVLGSLVLPGLMTLVRWDKAKPYLISSLTPAAPFIEKTLSIAQGYSICHLVGGGGQTCFCRVYWQVKVQGSWAGWPYKYRALTGGSGSTGKLICRSLFAFHFVDLRGVKNG